MFNLRSRGSFIAAITLLQVVVVGLGWVGATQATRVGLAARVRERVIEESSRGVSHLAAAVAKVSGGKLRRGTEEWTQVEALLDGFNRAGPARIALLSEERELLYPLGGINGRPNPVLTLIPGEETMLLSELAPGTVVTAKAMWQPGGTGEDGESVISVLFNAQSGVKLVACTPGRVFAVAERALARDVLLWASLVGLAVLSITIGGSVMLVRRYDTMVMRMNRQLEAEVDRRTRRGLAIRNGLVFGLAKLADYRDTDTGKHLERICRYSELLAQRLAATHAEIDKAYIERLKLASSMHDIGKVGIPDSVLLKPGPLTKDERKLMETHASIGADTLMAIRHRVGDDDLLNMSVQVALCHHEKVDGTGYPNGLNGEQIPLCARIVALADMYDALTSVRVYKAAMSHEKAVAVIAAARGTHFDTRVCDAFDATQGQFDAARAQLQALGGAGLRAAA